MEAGCWMLDERLAVAEADGQRAQMHVVEHLLGFREAAHLERDNAAEPRHLADGHGVIGMVLQTGIEHFLHILGAGKEVHHFLRVRADGVVLDSFQAGQSETGPVYDFATSTPLATREETRQFVALADELAQQRPDALLRYPPTRRRCGSIWPRAASRPRMRIFLSSTAASRASTSSERRLSARIRSCSSRTPAIRSRCIASSAPARG